MLFIFMYVVVVILLYICGMTDWDIEVCVGSLFGGRDRGR